MLSFVLVVHREQGYLAECVASILDQGFADAEIVAIDDGTPDPAVLDELAERDFRVRVLRPKVRVGPGGGRNLALALAHGHYAVSVEPSQSPAADVLAVVHG